VAITLEYMPTAAQQMALLEGRVDIGFMIGPFEVQKARSVLVDEQDYVALLPESHPLARRETLRLPDLAGEPFVMGSSETFGAFRTRLFDLCHGARFFPNVVQEASNSGGIFGLVAAGAGVSVYAGCARNVCRTGVVVRPLIDISDPIPIHAARLTDHASAALRRFEDLCVLRPRASARRKARQAKGTT